MEQQAPLIIGVDLGRGDDITCLTTWAVVGRLVTLVTVDCIQHIPRDEATVVRRAIDSFGPLRMPLEFATEAMKNFSAEWLEIACKQYMAHHRRLPGGTRTPRLRKKRRTKVLAWFGARHDTEPAGSIGHWFAADELEAGS